MLPFRKKPGEKRGLLIRPARFGTGWKRRADTVPFHRNSFFL